MRTVTLGILFGALVILFESNATAETYTHEEGAVEIWAPPQWEVAHDDGTMTISEPNGEASMVFSVLDADDLDDAIDGLMDGLAEYVDDIEMSDDSEEGNVNGMDTIVMNVCGEIDGEPVACGILLIVTPADKILLALSILPTATVEAQAKTVNKILQSIKPS